MTDRLFVTVGAQMAFGRLVQVVDDWVATTERDVEVFAQVGPADSHPIHLPHVDFMGPQSFAERIDWADVIVSHAGMGTIISALVSGKPLVLLPRQGILNETRNDHQVGTAERFSDRPGVIVVADRAELIDVLEKGEWPRPEAIGAQASDQLIETIREFVSSTWTEPPATRRRWARFRTLHARGSPDEAVCSPQPPPTPSPTGHRPIASSMSRPMINTVVARQSAAWRLLTMPARHHPVGTTTPSTSTAPGTTSPNGANPYPSCPWCHVPA